MNIQEAKALALERVKEELDYNDWTPTAHGFKRGSWLVYPRYGDGVSVLLKGQYIFEGTDERIANRIRSLQRVEEDKNETEIAATILNYLSKHPLEAP